MKLSVILPASPDDAREFLPAALASLDASVAAAPANLRESVELEKIAVVDADRRGVSWARNEGLRRATEDYIGWLDSDDAVATEWFASIARVLLDERPDIATFDSTIVSADGVRKIHGYGRSAGRVDNRVFLVDVLRTNRTGGYLWRNVFRRRLFDGLSFSDDVAGMEDYVLLPELVARALQIFYIPKPLYDYRLRPQSLTNGNHGPAALWKHGVCEDRARRWSGAGAELAAAANIGAAFVLYGRLFHRASGVRGPGNGMHDRFALIRKLPAVWRDGDIGLKNKIKLTLPALWLERLMILYGRIRRQFRR